MKKLLMIIVIFLGLGIITAQAQDKRIEVKSKNVAKTRGENPYIKVKATTSDETPIAAPDVKTSKECSINVANNTGFVVEVYVDGNSKGTLDAWSESAIKVKSGYKTIYAITTGKTKEWFADGDCNGKYTFVLLVGDK